MANIVTRLLLTELGKSAVTYCTLLPGHGISVRTLSTTILFILENPKLSGCEVPLHFLNCI